MAGAVPWQNAYFADFTALIHALILASSTGSGSAPVPSDTASGSDAVIPDDADVALPSVDAPNKPEEPEAPDPGKVIADLGAISA